jgi:hypothetical protein
VPERSQGQASSFAQQSRFGENAFQKIILQSQLADFGVQRRQLYRLWLRATPKHVGGFFKQLLLPLRDL